MLLGKQWRVVQGALHPDKASDPLFQPGPTLLLVVIWAFWEVNQQMESPALGIGLRR